jgi:hypothetical protein
MIRPFIDDQAGIVYTLNLGRSFDTSTDNLTALFEPLPKGVAGNIAPTAKEGVMFANDNQFILYGLVFSIPVRR